MRSASGVSSTSSNLVLFPQHHYHSTVCPYIHTAAQASSSFLLFLLSSPSLHSSLSPSGLYLSSGWGLVPLVHNHERAPRHDPDRPSLASLGQELGPRQQEGHINWVSLMCKLMFREHREKIT